MIQHLIKNQVDIISYDFDINIYFGETRTYYRCLQESMVYQRNNNHLITIPRNNFDSRNMWKIFMNRWTTFDSTKNADSWNFYLIFATFLN